MKILFIGDIVGKDGRKAVTRYLKEIKEKYQIDFVIANGENSAHGKGITKKIYYQLMAEGVDCITMGNHTFSKDVIKESINDLDNLVRPCNLYPLNYGQTYKVFNVKGHKVCVTNILGTVFMDQVLFSPYEAMDEILNTVKADYYIVDLHAEATSEKITFAYYYQDKIHAVLGTHTHVQTADERLIGNLCFISDVGMTGPYESVLGRSIEEVINNSVNHMKTKFEVAQNDAIFQAVVFEIDEKTNKTVNIERIQIRPNEKTNQSND